jgi:hypothetical protein
MQPDFLMGAFRFQDSEGIKNLKNLNFDNTKHIGVVNLLPIF